MHSALSLDLEAVGANQTFIHIQSSGDTIFPQIQFMAKVDLWRHRPNQVVAL